MKWYGRKFLVDKMFVGGLRGLMPKGDLNPPRITSKVGTVILMGMERIELSWVAPYAPQTYAYTNSATSP